MSWLHRATCFLPAGVCRSVLELVQDPSKFAVPNKSQISRWRVLLDVAYMLWTREALAVKPVTTYCMIDSSTQGGKDYELIVVAQAKTIALPRLYRAAISLISMRQVGP